VVVEVSVREIDESGIQVQQVEEKNENPYPRIYLRNGEIIYGSRLSKAAEDTFEITQEIVEGGSVIYEFSLEEIQKIRLWPPSDEELPRSFKKLREENMRFSYRKGAYHILSTVISSDFVLYTKALQRFYDDFLLHFLDILDPHLSHGTLPLIIFGNYNQFLESGGFPKGTNIAGYYRPDTKALYLYNVKEIDMIQFQLLGADYVGHTLGQAMARIENLSTQNSSGKWAAYDQLQKIQQ